MAAAINCQIIEGGNLAITDTPATTAAVSAVLEQAGLRKRAYIGMFYDVFSSQFRWVNSQPATGVTNWDDGFPTVIADSASGSNTFCVTQSKDGKLQTTSCFDNKPYVCSRAAGE